MKAWLLSILASVTCLCIGSSAIGAQTSELQVQFQTTVRPFVGTYCTGCHSGNTPAAQFDLKAFTSLDAVKADFGHWSLVADRLSAQEMPPKPRPAPPAELVAQVIAWVHAVRTEEINRLAGDPGTVLARRLSNAEYDYTIRDLTGQDMQVAREFPIDPANTAGFDNSGESLTMSPALLNKYLQAARQVADHMFLRPNGIDFAPYGMRVETDREKYSIQRILAFYAAQPTDYAQYFEAAWRYRYRNLLGNPRATLASIAAQQKLSGEYLPKVWAILHDRNPLGPVATLQKMWNGLPVPIAAEPDAGQQAAIATQSAQMRDFVIRIRTHTAMQFAAPKVKGLPGQSEPLHNWRLKQYAAHHRDSDPNDLRADSDLVPPQQPVPKDPPLHADASPRWAVIAANARADDADLVYPAGQLARYQKAFARFAFVFPDTFYVTERGRYWPDDTQDQGRLLSAGYHNSGGYYRDDTALMQLILNAKGRKQLDVLWNEFDFVANQTANTWTQYYFNQSGEVDGKGDESGSARPTDHEITDTAVIMGLRDKYLAKAAADPKSDPDAVFAIRDHFALMDTTFRSLEKTRTAAEPQQLNSLLDFAARSYRRPLTAAERADLMDYYKTLRSESKLSHEDAVRETIVRILMSPDFLYRFDLSQAKTTSGPTGLRMANGLSKAKAYVSEPLSDYSLASRLSYFLWSSMPDAELLRHAAVGDLHKPIILLAETRRMLKDERVRGLATEFAGNWLGFRQFETNNSIDRVRFPEFNDELREAMFQEPIRFLEDNIVHDGSVLDLIYGNYTFVNPSLARHYGMPGVSGDANNWVRVDNADKYQRGGILPMAVFMTEYSPGLRTSPVKRGNWVVQKVLGIRVPPPPPVVPELPSDESKSDLPVRDMLAQHRANPVCAACHARFDSLGLAFEGYGPVGEARTHDLAGRLVDTSVTFPEGVEGTGLAGLQSFIRGHRQDQFLDNISRKLLAFSLNRSLQLSDEALIDQMKINLAANNYRLRNMVETIVVSPEFRNRRADEQTATGPGEPQGMGTKLIKIDYKKGEATMTRPTDTGTFRSRAFSRRVVLRGAGCTMALPWMESINALADTPTPADFPQRFGVVFLGCGINEDHWGAEGNGADMKLSKTLEPLDPLKQKLNVIDGLYVKTLTNEGIHPGQTGSLLSGEPITKGAIIHSGISVDQMIANHVGQDTPQSSIVLSCEQPMTGYHETNFSLAYSSHLSWQTPDSPVPVEVYPSLAWDSLFDNRGSLLNISLLDRVRDRAQHLSSKISASDRGKLDEYLTSVREIEKRVEVMRSAKSDAEDAAKGKNTVIAAMERPANGLPEDLREHAKLMCDIIAIAFQTNKTRVASLLISRDLSAMYYPFLDVKDGHHSASHNNNSDDYERIARFHVSQYAYLASKLDSMKEGDGTVLDNSCLMFLSNMWIGRKHDNFRLPLILTGGLGGTLQTGRTLSYLDAGEDKRKMCSLYLSLMDRFGLKLDKFGDAQTRLENI